MKHCVEMADLVALVNNYILIVIEIEKGIKKTIKKFD